MLAISKRVKTPTSSQTPPIESASRNDRSVLRDQVQYYAFIFSPFVYLFYFRSLSESSIVVRLQRHLTLLVQRKSKRKNALAKSLMGHNMTCKSRTSFPSCSTSSTTEPSTTQRLCVMFFRPHVPPIFVDRQTPVSVGICFAPGRESTLRHSWGRRSTLPRMPST